MFGIGIGEIILILIIGILVVGPERMVVFARDAGRLLAKFRRETDSVSKEFREALELDDLQEALNEAQSEIQGVAKDLQTTQREVEAIAAETQATVADAVAEAAPPGTTLPLAGTRTRLTPATASAAPASRAHQVTPASLAPTLLRDGEAHPTKAPQSPTADEDQPASQPPEAEDAAMEVGIPQIVLEDHEVEPIVLDEPILVMDKEEAEQAEEALREAAIAGVAEMLEEDVEPTEEALPPEAEVAQALEEGASMVITEPSLVEDEEDEHVIQEDVVVAWETDVQLVVEDEEPQDLQTTEVIVSDLLPDENVDAAPSQSDTEAVESEAEDVPSPDTTDDGEEASVSEETAVPTTEDEAVEDGDSKG